MNLGIVDINIFELIYIKKKARIDTTNLYEIDGLINALTNSLEDDKEENQQTIRNKVPGYYYEYLDIFNKAKSNVLPEYKTGINH